MFSAAIRVPASPMLWTFFSKAHPEFWGREMDDVRLETFPGSVNDKPKRNASYRILHFEASQHLQRGQSVALNGTYLPPNARAELSAMVLRFDAALFVIQCSCSSDLAVKRFLERHEQMKAADNLHAGADLTTTRVRSLAEEFVRFEEALTVDTTEPASASILRGRIEEYLEHSEPARPIAWANHEYRNQAQAGPDGKAVATAPIKLSADAIKKPARMTFFEQDDSLWVHLPAAYPRRHSLGVSGLAPTAFVTKSLALLDIFAVGV